MIFETAINVKTKCRLNASVPVLHALLLEHGVHLGGCWRSLQLLTIQHVQFQIIQRLQHGIHQPLCMCPKPCRSTCMLGGNYYYYFASAAVTVDSSHITASSSASWSGFCLPSNFVNRHVSAMWFMVCRWPQTEEGDWMRPHLCKLARHGP